VSIYVTILYAIDVESHSLRWYLAARFPLPPHRCRPPLSMPSATTCFHAAVVGAETDLISINDAKSQHLVFNEPHLHRTMGGSEHSLHSNSNGTTNLKTIFATLSFLSQPLHIISWYLDKFHDFLTSFVFYTI
jgi:hypothetical protein